MSRNRFKSEIEKEASKGSKKKQATNKAKRSGKLSIKSRFTKAKEWIKSEKTQQIVGLLFILFSAYLLIAFTSFLFTWKADQSKVELPFNEYFSNTDILVENWLGKIGAAVSHLFIFEWFGIAAFLFVGLFFLYGFKILFNISLLHLSKATKVSFFLLLWLSLFFTFFFHEQLFFLGGGIGYEMNNFLLSVLGKIGTGMLLFFILTIFLIINLNFASYLKSAFPWSKESSIKNDTIENLEEDEEEEIESMAIVDNYEKEPEDLIDTEEEEVESDNVQHEVEAEDEDINELSEAVELSTETPENEEDVVKGVSFEVASTTAKEEQLSDKDLNKKVKDFGEYDPTLDLSNYKMPGIDLLSDHGEGVIKVNKEELEQNKNRIVKTLENYNIKIDSIKATIGPTVTLYEIIPAPGVRISKIKNLEDDIALSLAALGIRIIAPIPGKGTIGIEVPNQNPDIVSMKSVLATEKFQNSKYDLPVALGKTISNETFVFDLAKMPHLLMAGATGQGKSVGLNAILTSLLYKKHPAQLKFVLVDPKKVELTLFNKIERHFLAKLPDSEDAIITDNQKVINTLNSLCIEMDNRYELLKSAYVRNIKEYNAKFIARKLNPENGHKFLPYIVVVIDEFADLIMTAGKEVEQPIARLAQLARAIGIHLVIATQRPSTNIITGSIKANFPARIAFRVTSGIDSRTILDSGGAEQLIGRGDMLLSTGSDLIRLQCAFVDTPEVEELTEFIGSQRAYPDAYLLPEYQDEESKAAAGAVDLSERDKLFEDAARIIVQHQQGSASLLQRRLKLGYNRAGRIIDQLEVAGIIGPFEGSKARQVLIVDENSLEQLLTEIDHNN